MQQGYEKVFKIILVGSAKVGKSSVLLRFTDNTFKKEYQPTIGVEFGTKVVEADGKKYKLQLWDTAGDERFRSITSAYYRGSNAIVLIFNIADKKSFDEIDKFIKDTRVQANETTGFMMVGNFCDKENERTVTYQEAMDKANSFGIPYMEISALTGHNIEQVFEQTVKSLIGNTAAMPKPPPVPIVAPSQPVVAHKLVITPKVDKKEENTEEVKAPKELEEFLTMKLEAIKKIVTILGSEGSLLVDNLRKVLDAKNCEKIEVDSEGNLSIH